MPTWRQKKTDLENHAIVDTGLALPLARFIFHEDGEYVERTTRDLFRDKRVVLFALPGAFTPTCSNNQVPDYEAAYDDLIAAGVDEVYCLSMNDPFVMNAWRESLGVQKVKFLPDGNGFFSRQIGKNVFKSNVGLGVRSWRYSSIIDSDQFEVIFSEDGQSDNCTSDPYEITKPSRILDYLKEVPRSVHPEDEGSQDELNELEAIERDLFLT
jgi:peroxiredoxin|tara:strand:- start:1365 stop:2000 length:636 start_codon:yes stop_codon:yes gene_type:complete